MLEKLKKLRGRNLNEFKERGRQGVSMFAERFGVSAQTKLPTDAELFQKFELPAKDISAVGLLEHFRSRKTGKFYASFEKPEATILELRKHFPVEEAAIINRADRICEGFFDLLGYENLYFKNKIPDWHHDPISGKTSPKIHWSRIEEVNAAETGDKKIIWELNRQQYFTTLGRAYWLTKDEKYAATFVAHLENWLAENPPKIGVNWLSSLELAFRSISWIWAFYFFKDSPQFTSQLFARIIKYLYLHARHLETYLSTYFSPNTHLTGEALGLYFLGDFLPKMKEARRWKNLGYKILLDALDFQVRADGVYCEQSSHYHRYTVDFYANLFILRQLEGEPIEQKHREKLNQLYEFLLFINEPNGETALFGDDDGGRFYFLDERPITDFRPTLATGAALFGRGDLKFAAKEASAELLWLLGAEGLRKFDELEAVEPTKVSKAFETSGFFAMRDSWAADANFILVDCGIHGFMNGGHAHADALNFILSFGGEPIFVDSGTYNYTSDLAARQLFRSTSAHNFGVGYEREVLLTKHGAINLTDSIKSVELNSYELNFILAPNVEAEINDESVTVFYKKNRNRVLLSIYTKLIAEQIDGEGVWRIENCWVSPRYGARVESRKLVFTARVKGDFQICNRFDKATAEPLR
jgi:hypothetical protein